MNQCLYVEELIRNITQYKLKSDILNASNNLKIFNNTAKVFRALVYK